MKAEGRDSRSTPPEGRDGQQSTTTQSQVERRCSRRRPDNRRCRKALDRTAHQDYLDRGARSAARVNFSISVGTRVPRDVRFYPLPREVMTIYPEWRGYEFILVSGQIIVIDPRTFEIVAILDA
jgi:hypothetical protein